MLITALEKEREQIREEGRVEGIEQGIEQGRAAMQTTIEQLLTTRFGNVTNEIITALTNCTLDQLQSLVNPALDSPDLDAFLTHIPDPIDEEQTDADSQPDQDRDEIS